MHVVLTIAKIIGMILLVVLALVLLVVLCVLFVPIRYRARVIKEEKPLSVSAQVSWLFKLLRLDITYRDKAGQAVLRVLWFRLKTLNFPEKKQHAQKKTSGDPQEITSEDPQEKTDRARAYSVRGDKDSQSERAHTSAEDTGKRENGEGDRERKSAEEAGKSDYSGEDGAAGGGFLAHLRAIAQALPERVNARIEQALDFALKLIDLPFDVYASISDQTDRMVKKAEDLERRLAPFLGPEAAHVVRKLLDQMLYLLRGIRPKRITGYVRFGTGQPDLTGKLTGLLYVLLPAGAEQYEIHADFYEKMLQTDTQLCGTVRLYRAVVVLMRLLLDKQVRTLVRRIRHKEPGKRRSNHG